MPPRSRATSTKAKQVAAVAAAVVAAQGTDSVPIHVVTFAPETQAVLDESERFEMPQQCYGDPHGAAKAIADLRWFIKANLGETS